MKTFRIFTLVLAGVILFPYSSSAIYFDPVEKYAQGKPIEILIVPGHDDKNSGAVFRGMREADMTLTLAEKLAHELSSDPQVFVTVTRNRNGFTEPLKSYLTDNEDDINKFIKKSKEETQRFLEKNDETVASGVVHNNAPSEVAYTLYGINKWVAEESFDFVIHIHFNDDTSHYGNNIGEFGGFTIYVPEKNLPNAEKSLPWADSIGSELKKTFFRSSLPSESIRSDENGVVPDFKLISLGSNMTLKTPSILVEYSYIYEPNLAKEFFDLTSSVMARATARGLFNMLSGEQSWNSLSYGWHEPLYPSVKKEEGTLALQYGLRELGFFPPKNFNRNSCPTSGIFGPCTIRALKEFQKANNLDADGLAGPKTLSVLNALFNR
jgi:N-acetylmuramoyl-L-alanine amidase